jgi:glycosyltransferase involved in cell wall biosynthesis
MRIGENPTKFARHNPGLVRLDAKVPEALLAATVVYIPRLADYYAEALEVLKLSLMSLRATLTVPFDLLVVDNGSCHEVIEYLRGLQAREEIQWLWLSSRNMKKIGAWNHIFGACQADLVYFFDSDILHLPGWFEASKAVLDAYPRAAMVNAAPIPPKNPTLTQATLGSTIALAEADPDVLIERGNFTPDEHFREFGESLGAVGDEYLAKARRFEQIRLVRAGVPAFAQSWHAQFLARGNIMRSMFPKGRKWVLENKERDFDEEMNRQQYMRLATVEPFIAHMGNSITPRHHEEMKRLGIAKSHKRVAPKVGPIVHALMKLPPIYRLILRLHALTFRLIYNVRR